MHEVMGPAAARQMPEQIKGIALSCILSDTLEFRSPTTTADRPFALAEELAASLSIDVPSYAAEMFAAKSDMSSYSNAELLEIDAKQYEISGKRLRISVLETTSPSAILGRRDGLMDEMEALAKKGRDRPGAACLWLISWSGRQPCLCPMNSRADSREKSFSAAVTGNSVVLPGVMSRKKQIIPSLSF